MPRPGRLGPLALAALVSASALALVPVSAGAAPPAVPDPDGASLSGWASLPADTFVPGSERSGYFTGNPAAPFPGQPVQGFSAIHALPDGTHLVMSDNGFGTKANSPDFLLRVQHLAPNPEPAGDGSVDVLGGFHLSDPQGYVDWDLWRDGGCADAATLPAGYTCPAPDRMLTGWDFDIESMQVARDGTFWFGDELGPYLLHTDEAGRLLEAPVPTPGVKSPSNPTLGSGAPNLANSKGFEGMAISPDGRTLYPMLEGPTAEDSAAGRASDLRIYEVDLRKKGGPRFTDTVRRYRMEAPGNALGDFIAVNHHEALVIERDNKSGSSAAFKRIYLVDLRDRNGDGYLDKHLLVDLMDVANPDGLGGFGPTFTFPYVTIEDVELLDRDTIAVLNDNNYPGTGGRGPGTKDVNEYLEIDLGAPLRVDPRLLP
jgi:hypothetical protein